MYNATNSAPHRPSLHRLNSLLSLSLLSTAQLNDLFVTTPLHATCLGAVRRTSPQFNSTICLSIYPRFEPQLYSTSRSVTLCYSTICLSIYRLSTLHDAPHCFSMRSASSQLNSTICLSIYYRAVLHCSATLRAASQRAAIQRNDLFVNLLSHVAPLRSAFHRGFAQPNATICLSIYHRTALLCSARHLNVALRNSTICLSIYYRASTRLSATNRGATRLAATRSNSTQRFVCQFILRNSAPHNETQQTAA